MFKFWALALFFYVVKKLRHIATAFIVVLYVVTLDTKLLINYYSYSEYFYTSI